MHPHFKFWYSVFINWCLNVNEKRSETQTLHTSCSKVEPKKFASLQTPFPGVWDVPNLISWRWSLPIPTNPVWWGSMYAISSYHTHPQTHTQPPTQPQTNRQDRLRERYVWFWCWGSSLGSEEFDCKTAIISLLWDYWRNQQTVCCIYWPC